MVRAAPILDQIGKGHCNWVGSEVLLDEIAQTADLTRQTRMRLFLKKIERMVAISQGEVERARQLIPLGIQAMDALHLDCAESGGATVMLTTDDRLLRAASRLAKDLRISVANPVQWLLDKMRTQP